MRLGNLVVVALCLAITATASGQRGKLEIGDPAPGLNLDVLFAGDEVTIGTNVAYLVVFWDKMADGSNAMSSQLARLKDIATNYRHTGLTILIVSADSTDKLLDFTGQHKVADGITLASDTRTSTRRAWAGAAGARTLPITFLVGNGKIMYMGHLGDEGFEDTLVQVISGRYDPVLQAQAEPMLAAARRARKAKNWRMATKHYDEAIALNSRVFAVVALERFEMMMVEMDEPQKANAYARAELVEKLFSGDAGALRMLAAEIVADPRIPNAHRDFDLALAAAEMALELDGGADPEALSAVARIHFNMGNISKAIDLQTGAYFSARPESKEEYRRVLRSYQAAVSRTTAGHRRRR